MRFPVVLACMLLVCAFGASAQVSVKVISDREEFVPHEELRIGVQIENFSGRTLHFGQDYHWLRLDVEGQGGPAEDLGTLPILGEFSVESSTRVTRWLDIAPHYGMTAGRYMITANLNIREPGWEEQVASLPKIIYQFPGRTIWEQQIGVPPSSLNPGPPEFRKFSLLQANFYNSRMKLYYRVTELDETKVIKVAAVDHMAGFSKVDAQIDKFSNLHVLLQTPRQVAREYNYTIITPDGRVLARRFYDGADDRPKLAFTDDGLIRVTGGTLLGNDEARLASAMENEGPRESLGVPEGAESLSAPSEDAEKPEEGKKKRKSKKDK